MVAADPRTPESKAELHPYDFNASGPRNLSSPNWRDLFSSSWRSSGRLPTSRGRRSPIPGNYCNSLSLRTSSSTTLHSTRTRSNRLEVEICAGPGGQWAAMVIDLLSSGFCTMKPFQLPSLNQLGRIDECFGLWSMIAKTGNHRDSDYGALIKCLTMIS